MLDEVKEYEQYTFEIDEGLDLGSDRRAQKKSDHRLRKIRFIGKNLSGLPRAMEIIARQYLFSEGRDIRASKSNLEMKQALEDVEEVLKRWCGFEGEGLQDSSNSIDCWVPRYMEKLGRGAAISNAIERWKDGKAKKRFGKVTLFGARSNKDDRHMIFYERVIAEALRQGPLRRRCLVRNFREGDGVLNDEVADVPFKKGNGLTQNDKGRKLDGSNTKYILELTAIFLMQNDKPCPSGVGDGGWLCANVSLDRMLDWACIDTNAPDRETVLGWQYKGKPLLAVTPIGESDSLWYMQPAWIEDYGWRIVDEADIDQLKNSHDGAGCVIYREVPFGEKKLRNSRIDSYYYPFCTPEFYEPFILP